MSTMRTRFAMVPEWVYDRVTSGGALRVYLHLACRYADTDRHCFPSEKRLAHELGYTLRAVQYAIQALRDADAILVTRSRKPNGDYGPNRYTLPMDDPRDDAMHRPQTQNIAHAVTCGNGDIRRSGAAADFCGSEPDPPKEQPDPETPTSTDRSAGADPPARGAAGLSDLANFDHHTLGSRPGSQTKISGTEDHKQDHASCDQDIRADDPEPTSNPDDYWASDTDRIDRLTELVEQKADGLALDESQTALHMISRGEHWRKVLNTILKQRATETTR